MKRQKSVCKRHILILFLLLMPFGASVAFGQQKIDQHLTHAGTLYDQGAYVEAWAVLANLTTDEGMREIGTDPWEVEAFRAAVERLEPRLGGVVLETLVEFVENAEPHARVEVPAEYRTITRRVMATSASTRRIEIPAEYETVTALTLQKEARVYVPPKFETKTERVIKKEASSRSSEEVLYVCALDVQISGEIICETR